MPAPLRSLAVFCLVAGCSHEPVASPPPPPPPPAAPEPPRVEMVTDQGRTFRIEHGAAADPSIAGCADGHREAFLDLAAFPSIAGCLATWEGDANLRTAPTGKACGDELGPCASPADACAAGWHVCGDTGRVADLRQISGEQCEKAGGGRYSSAISHCKSQSGCLADTSPDAGYACYATGWCSEPVCCGNDCGQFGACKSGVWTNLTHIPQGQAHGCAKIPASRAGGVLCCK